MKHLKSLFLVLPLLVCSGCNNEPSTTSTSPEPVPPAPAAASFDVSYTLTASLRKKETTKTGGYDLTFTFKDEYFKGNPTAFNKDLAMISYGNVLMSESESEMNRFYQTCQFDDIESHYVATKTADTVSYMFAHRKIDDFDLVGISICGFNYGKEWAGNFMMGSSGNHQNFEAKAIEINNALQTYLTKYPNKKVWLSGYSRAGGIANVMSHLVLSNPSSGLTKDNMFVYTFEAPKGLDVSNKIAYENVFNLVNSRDLITMIAPEQQYGFARCGIDIDIYQDNFNELIAELDEDIVVPEFKPDEYGKYTNNEQFMNYILNYVTRDEGDVDQCLFFPTRSDYASTLQGPLCSAFDLVFGLSDEAKNQIMSDLMAMMEKNPLDILGIFLLEGGIYNFLTPYLDEYHYPYDPTSFMADTEVLRQFANAQLLIVVALATGSAELGDNLKRVIDMHFPETNYVLLRSFEKTN